MKLKRTLAQVREICRSEKICGKTCPFYNDDDYCIFMANWPEDWKIDDLKDAVYQKPLTVDELKNLPTPCVAILEERTNMSIRPVTIWRVDDLSVQFRGDCGLWLSEYGYSQRLWRCGTFRNPTDEERSAAQWRT